MTKIELFLFISVSCVVAFVSTCGLPQDQWCKSKSNAERCNVVEDCEKYNREEIRRNLTKRADNGDVLKLGFYYETMSPLCRQFMLDQLLPAIRSLSGVFTVDFVPYGTSNQYNIGGSWKFTCVRGETECQGNIIQTCAFNLYPYNSAVQFIMCMMMYSEELAGKYCAHLYNLDWEKLLSCSTSNEGNVWQHEMATKTMALEPPLQYVPWFTLDGQHSEAIQNQAISNLEQLICQRFKDPKPEICTLLGY